MTLEVYGSWGYYGSSDYFNVLIVYGPHHSSSFYVSSGSGMVL